MQRIRGAADVIGAGGGVVGETADQLGGAGHRRHPDAVGATAVRVEQRMGALLGAGSGVGARRGADAGVVEDRQDLLERAGQRLSIFGCGRHPRAVVESSRT